MANGIYALISKERLNDILQTLYSFTGIPIQLVDPQGASLETFGRAAYCGVLGGNPPCGDSCAELLSKASLYAQQSGDTYIFSCHAGLDLIAFPLTNKGDILGSVIVGPFQMDRPDHTILAALAEEFFLPAPVLLKAYDALSDMRPVPLAGQRSEQAALLPPLSADSVRAGVAAASERKAVAAVQDQ